MERILPNLTPRTTPAGGAPEADGVALRRNHLLLSAEVAGRVLPGERQAYAVYYPQRKSLLLAPMSDKAFKSLHECTLLMIKDKNIRGDKVLFIGEIIIDHDLNSSDRPLEFTISPSDKMLRVLLE